MIKALDGKTPKIHKDAFVSEFAYLVGDIEIGAYSSIWPGVVIRADSGKSQSGKIHVFKIIVLFMVMLM